jgi:RNA 3'-terminal phosphate cyclase (ATP)
VSLASHLRERKVADRMASECRSALAQAGLDASFETIEDTTAAQAGAALAVFAELSSGGIIGADGAGAPRRPSEEIGRGAARRLIEDIASGASVDRFLADQLIIFAALAEGTTRYRIPMLTDHVESNLWLVERLLGARTEIRDGREVEITGVGHARHAT